MAYNLPLQLSIQAPSTANINAIKKQIEAGLGGIKIGGFDSKSFTKANSQIKNTTDKLKKGEEAATGFFDAVQGKARSFAAYTVASTSILKLTNAVSQATREAIKFETELIKISQVTGDSIKQTGQYAKSLANISKEYNVTLSKVAQLTRTLTQTGLSFKEAAKGAEILAKTSLLATFDSLTSTTEGLIAVMQTFNLTVKEGGKVLEQINAVSKQFAVESGDIVEAIRRTGGAFSTAGGQIEELIALFTAVRSTSRESAETIATGFRTIFGRLQRPKTIEFFKELGIQLETAEGQFIGPYQAILQISKGLERLNIQAGSTKFAQVVEQIGGIRQISRVVPLLEEAAKSQKALDIANNASAESAKDVEKAQQGLGFQLGQLQKEFGTLISDVVNSSSFKFLAETFINTSKAVIRLVSSLQPLLPILATVAAFKIGRGLTSLLSGKINLGGLKGFASGGMVPGSGNSDTVPAMLTPGEFVIRKSAVQAFGASNLASINKYKNGGKTYKPKNTGDPLLKYERFGRIGSKGLQQSAVSYSEINELGLEPAVAGGLKGAMYEKYMQQRYGIDKPDGSGSFPDVNPSKAAQLVKDAGLGAKVGNKLLDGAELKYRLTEDTVKRYREGLRGQKSAQNIPMIYAEGQKFAKGGAVGTDTVPALLTPGEFVINKKSAQSFGYGNLENINRYADGGVVLSKQEKKRRREEDRSQKMGSVLSRGERTGGIYKEIAAKYNKLFAEEKAMLKDYYQEKANAAIKEGKSVQEVLNQYRAAVAEAKQSMQVAGRSEMKGARNTIIEKLTKAAKPAAKEVTTFSKKLSNATKYLDKLNVSFVEVAFGAQALVSGLKNFAGLNVNQEAMTQATTRAAGTAAVGDAIGAGGNRKNVFLAGKSLEKFGKMIPGVGDKVAKFGKTMAKNAGSIAKGAKTVAKGLNILAGLDIASGIIDALLSTDYGKQKDQFIEMGDAAGAAAAAAKEYNQQFLRGIPIIGGLLSGLLSVTGLLPTQADATGRLVAQNAKLAASINSFNKEITRSQKNLSQAQAQGDQQGIQNAYRAQLNSLDQLNSRIDTSSRMIEEAGDAGFNFGKILAKGATYAASGASIGATAGAVGGTLGLPGIGTLSAGAVGGIAGGVIGGIIGVTTELYTQITTSTKTIVEGYEFMGEGIKAASEAQVQIINQFGSALTSEVQKTVRAGGSYADALEKVTERIGKQNVDRLLGDNKLTGDAETDAKTLGNKIQDQRTKLIEKENEKINESSQRKKAAIQVEIDRIEADMAATEAIRDNVIAAKAMEIQEKALAKERAIAAKALAEEIKLRKDFQKAVDSANQSLRDINNIAEEIGNIGTGKLTFRQAGKKADLGVDPKVLEMSTEEIMRNKDAMSQMSKAVSRFAGSGAGNVVSNAQKSFERLEKISSADFLKNIELGSKEGGTTDVNAIQQQILSNLEGYVQGSDAIFESAVLTFAKGIQGGVENAGASEQQAREEVSKLAAEFIEKNKELLTEAVKKEQQLRELEIELTNRRLETAQNIYNMEQELFTKRMELLTGTQDFLSPVAEGPGKASAIASRGKDRRAIERGGLLARRGESFNRSGFGGNTLNQAVQTFAQKVTDVNNTVGDVGTAFAELQGQSQVLLQTIQDEIRIEQEYLQVLKDTASAQQEYQQALNDAQGSIVRDLVTGTDAEVKDQLKVMNAAAVAAQQGSFEGIPEDMKKDIFGLFDQFADVEIPGLGMTGRDAQREITKNEMMRKFGVDEATATQMASKAVQDKVPISEQMASAIQDQTKAISDLYDAEEVVKRQLLAIEDANNQQFGQYVQEFRMAVAEFRNKLIQGGAGQEAAGMVPGVGNAPAEANAAAQAQVQENEAQRDVRLMSEAAQGIPSYGLSESQQQLAQNQVNLMNRRSELKSQLDSGEITQQEYDEKFSRNTIALSSTNNRLSGVSATDVQLYQDAYRNNLAAGVQGAANNIGDMIPTASTASTAPQPNNIATSTAPNTANEPIKLEAQGSQDIKVSLPDIQAVASKEITAVVYEQVAKTFAKVAEDVRAANDFNDVANALQNGIENSSTETIG